MLNFKQYLKENQDTYDGDINWQFLRPTSTNLSGSYKKVNGQFYCSFMDKLSSLEGGPEWVGSDFTCNNNYLVNLKGAPEFIGGDFSAYNNDLTSLSEGPKIVKGDVDLKSNKLTNLKGIGKDYFNEIGEMLFLQRNPIESHVLGLLKVKGLKRIIIDNKKVEDIINKHLKSRDILACHEELVDNGLEDYAQL